MIHAAVVVGLILIVAGLGGFARPELFPGFVVTSLSAILHLLMGAVAIGTGVWREGTYAKGFLLTLGIVYGIISGLIYWAGEPANARMYLAIAGIAIFLGSSQKTEDLTTVDKSAA